MAGMYKSCKYCGRIHPLGYDCPRKPRRKRDWSAARKTPEDRLRSTSRWSRKRGQVKEDAQYLCEVCRDRGYVKAGEYLEVHHIEKLRERPDLLTDDTNLVALCVRHHRQADSGTLSKEYLRSLALRRIDRARG